MERGVMSEEFKTDSDALSFCRRVYSIKLKVIAMSWTPLSLSKYLIVRSL